MGTLKSAKTKVEGVLIRDWPGSVVHVLNSGEGDISGSSGRRDEVSEV